LHRGAWRNHHRGVAGKLAGGGAFPARRGGIRLRSMHGRVRRRLPELWQRRVGHHRRQLAGFLAWRGRQGRRALQLVGTTASWPCSEALCRGRPPDVAGAQPARAPACILCRRRSAQHAEPGRCLDRRELVRTRSLRPLRHPLRRASGPAPHPHRLRICRPRLPQGFPPDRQCRGSLRPGEAARGVRAGVHRTARAGTPRTIRDDSRYEQARAEREAGTK
jgi:hypothetical protein